MCYSALGLTRSAALAPGKIKVAVRTLSGGRWASEHSGRCGQGREIHSGAARLRET